MAFKTGLVVGFGAGYVLGTRAGRERYEQIRQGWQQLTASPTVQRAVGKTTGLAGQQGRRALSVVQHGVEKAGGAVKERLGKEGATDPWRETPMPGGAASQIP
jgi:hypothetical protein